MANQGQLLPSTDFQPAGMVDISAGPRATAQMYDIAAQTAKSMTDQITEHLAQRAEFNGKLAGARDASRIDPKTGELMPLDLPDPNSISIYDQAYRVQALQTYANVATIQARSHADQLADQHQADPAGLTTAWDAYTTKTIKGMVPEAVGLVQPDLVNLRNELISRSQVQAQQLARDDAYKTYTQADQIRTNLVQTDLRNIARGTGGPITPQQQDANTSKAAETINYSLDQEKQQLLLTQSEIGKVKFPDSLIQSTLIQKEKDYWSAFVTQQAAAYADTPKLVAGDVKRDTDAAYAFANSIPNKVPQGLFSPKELDDLTTSARSIYDRGASAYAQSDINATTANAADNATRYGDEKTRLEQLYIQGAQDDLSMDQLNKELNNLDVQKPKFDDNDAKNTEKRKGLIAEYTAKVGQFEENLKKWHVREQINTANSTSTNAGHPFTATGEGLPTIMAWDQRQTTARFGGVIPSADMDTGLFQRMHLDDNSGSIYRLGHLYTDEKQQFSNFRPGNDMDANNRVLANYDAMMATPRGAQVMQEDAPDAALRMETYRNARGTSKPIENFNLQMDANSKDGRVYRDERYNSAEAYLRRGIGNPHDTAATPTQGLVEAIQDSSYLNEHLNRIWMGMPDIAGAKAMPEFVRPGLVGTTLSSISNAAKQGIGLAPDQDITVVFDSKTPKAWQMATADAMANKGATEGQASNTVAMATMGNNNFGPSRLLFSPDMMSSDLIGKAMNATYTFGYASPEKWYGLPSYAVVDDMSIKAMRGNWWQKAEQTNPGIVPMGPLPFLGFMGELPPPGSPAFLKREFLEGNLRVQPKGIINGRMEYDVMLRVQGTNKEQWINLNPQGETWHYDMQATGNYADALKAASMGADASRRLQDKISPYLGDTIATGLSHLYGEGKAWEVEYAMKHREYDAAQAWWVEHHGILQNMPEHFATSLPVE